MAIVTSPNDAIVPTSDYAATRLYTRQTVLTESATVYSWLSLQGHRMKLEGTFAYPSGPGSDPTGTVTGASFDYNNDGSIDFEVAFPTPKSLMALEDFQHDRSLMKFLLGGADTMVLGGERDPDSGTIVFAADGPNGALSTPSMPDVITLTGSIPLSADKLRTNEDGAVFANDTVILDPAGGGAFLAGDLYLLGIHAGPTYRSVTFGNDSIAFLTPNNTTNANIFGDLTQNMPGSRFFVLDLGNDTITGSAGALTAYGDVSSLTGDDNILNGGADQINGGSADDFLVGDLYNVINSAERNLINGGDDTIIGRAGNDRIIGDVRNNLGDNTVVGGDDSLLGGPGDDVIAGDMGRSGGNLWGGDDTLRGGDGNDRLFADVLNSFGGSSQSGDDLLYGGNGDDTLVASGGTNALYGGADDDLLVQGRGDDTIDGGPGIDTIDFVGASAGVMVTLAGSSFAPMTGSGSDIIRNVENVITSRHVDTITGDAGDNVFFGSGTDFLDGGAGNDTIDYSERDVRIDVGFTLSTPIDFATGLPMLVNFENLIGTSYDDTLDGDAGDNLLAGGRGDDTLHGLGGADTLDGGDNGYGGQERDAAHYGYSPSAVNVNLQLGKGFAGDAAGDVLIFIEQLIGSDHNDTLTGQESENDTLSGGVGDDFLRGLAGNDRLEGEAGQDRMSGGDGNDSAYGGDGADVIFGQGDSDRLWGEAGEDRIYGGSGTDSAYGGDGADVIFGQGQSDRLWGDAGNDTLIGGGGNDRLFGGEGADLLSGNDMNDSLVGDAGSDTLSGAAGDDVLEGGSEDDRLLGGNGSDTLDGGAGADVLHGGGADAARDVYVFSLGYGRDRINGFEQGGLDQITLDQDLWLANAPGLTAQQVIDTYGSLNGTGSILTLDFGGGDVLEVQSSTGISQATLGADVAIV